MSLSTAAEPNHDSTWLVRIVSDCLHVSARELEPHVPLVRYGLDSLAAVQLTMAIASELRREVPEALLLEYPDIQSLENYVLATRLSALEACPGHEARETVERLWLTSQSPSHSDSVVMKSDSDWEQMLADSILPEDVQPASSRGTAEARSILITGATGFLGRYLVRSLLRQTSADLFCLVRPGRQGDTCARLRESLKASSLWDDAFESRIHVVAGDLLKPELGLGRADFDRLCREIDTIFHCAAAVNWVFPFAGLRHVNVLSTLELLRMACRHQAKPFHFVSTAATCYSTIGPNVVTEQEDTFPLLRGIQLGYAQTKCVAEALVRSAGQRGLPVTIFRPSLIIGDQEKGASSPGDLLPAMIKACVQMGSAPDLDWTLDCCPVDYVADAIAALAQAPSAAARVFHLTSSTKRHWREFVLWLNLFGYSIKLVPYREWTGQLAADSNSPHHPLHPLRSFFLRPLSDGSGMTLPELYAQRSHGRVSSKLTQQALADRSIESPPLSVRLIDRCITWLVDCGELPEVGPSEDLDTCRVPLSSFGRKRSAAECQKNKPLAVDDFEAMLRRYYGDDQLRVCELSTMEQSHDTSITTELTSWRYGTHVGLSTHQVCIDSAQADTPKSLNIFVKRKATDRQVLDVCQRVATVCDEKLGRSLSRWQDRIGILGSHEREQFIYSQCDDRFRRHTPALYGSINDESRQRWVLFLEHLSNGELTDFSGDDFGWNREQIESALRGAAEVHSIWYARERELAAESGLGFVMTADAMSEMKELWTSLAGYAWRYFSSWLAPQIQVQVTDWIESVGQWWRHLETMPRTLIHNDFNPRNLAFRREQESIRLCAFDWELACIGAPQHDLAELLCFVLPPSSTSNDIAHYVQFHRQQLERAANRSIDRDEWITGLRYSLRDLMINRFPFYCLIHTFRPQPFLEHVVRNWARLSSATAELVSVER